jgi:hypothetical protein
MIMSFFKVGVTKIGFTRHPDNPAFRFAYPVKSISVGLKSSRRETAVICEKLETVIGTLTVPPGQELEDPAEVTGAF